MLIDRYFFMRSEHRRNDRYKECFREKWDRKEWLEGTEPGWAMYYWRLILGGQRRCPFGSGRSCGFFGTCLRLSSSWAFISGQLRWTWSQRASLVGPHNVQSCVSLFPKLVREDVRMRERQELRISVISYVNEKK